MLLLSYISSGAFGRVSAAYDKNGFQKYALKEIKIKEDYPEYEMA